MAIIKPKVIGGRPAKPIPLHEGIRPPAPSVRHVWVKGDWVWNNAAKRYVWIKGRWVKR